jgi:hypothetical protein
VTSLIVGGAYPGPDPLGRDVFTRLSHGCLGRSAHVGDLV